MKIAVVGLGKIGLPLAVQFALKGHKTIGVDINESTVKKVNEGVEPFPKERDLQKNLELVVKSEYLKATTSYHEAISIADAIVIAVPVLVNEDGKPNFSSIDNASMEIAKFLLPGVLICYETTLPIGTTRSRLIPLLEEFSKKRVSEDFHVVYSPERVFTGRIFEDLRKYPKIVGGFSNECKNAGVAFYESVLEFDSRPDLSKTNGVWAVKNLETAEFIKLAETTYRDVNIGLANQFSRHADSLGVDIYEVIDAANSQPFSHIHQPGISVGGHCIPVYPHFYLQSDHDASIVRAARKVNDFSPSYAVEVLERKVGSLLNKKVLVLGVSYRPNVKESAFSGAFALGRSLDALGALPYYADPFYSPDELFELGLKPLVQEFSEIEYVILHTAHNQFKNYIQSQLPNCKLVIDGRNFFSNQDYSFEVCTLGKMI